MVELELDSRGAVETEGIQTMSLKSLMPPLWRGGRRQTHYFKLQYNICLEKKMKVFSVLN
jgi:hypothetical protein